MDLQQLEADAELEVFESDITRNPARKPDGEKECWRVRRQRLVEAQDAARKPEEKKIEARESQILAKPKIKPV